MQAENNPTQGRRGRTSPRDQTACEHAADMLAANAMRKQVAAYLGVTAMTSYKWVSNDMIEAAKARRAQRIAAGLEVMPEFPAYKPAGRPTKATKAPEDKPAEPKIDGRSKRRRFDDATLETMAQLIASGESRQDVANHYKISPQETYRYAPVAKVAEVRDARQELILNNQPLPELPAIERTYQKGQGGIEPKLDSAQRYQAALLIASGEERCDVRSHYHVSKATLTNSVPPSLVETAREELAKLKAEGKPLPELPVIVRQPRKPRKNGPKRKLTPLQAEAALERLANGEMRKVVSADFGICIRTLSASIPQEVVRLQQRKKQAVKVLLEGGTRFDAMRLLKATRAELLQLAPPDEIKSLLIEQKERAKATRREQRRLARVSKPALSPNDLPVAAKRLRQMRADVETQAALNPEDSVIAVPLRAAAQNAFMRKEIAELPFGWKPDELWQGFIAHNTALHANYLKAGVGDPLIDRMMLRFGIQRLSPARLIEAERDDFIREKAAEKVPGMVREVFLLIAKPAPGQENERKLLGELWVDTHQRADKGTQYNFAINPQAETREPTTVSQVFVLATGPAATSAKYRPLKPPVAQIAPEA